jgi:hypothetical protein
MIYLGVYFYNLLFGGVMYKFLFFIIISLFIFSCFEEDVDVDSTCSKTNLSGECSDEMSCIEGECKTLCSDTNLDGYCSDEMSCIDGECKFDMSGIKVNLINSKNDLIVSELTKKDGSFTITADNLVEVTEIRITNGDDLILRKRPGRVKYLKLSITNDKGGKLDYNFDT